MERAEARSTIIAACVAMTGAAEDLVVVSFAAEIDALAARVAEYATPAAVEETVVERVEGAAEEVVQEVEHVAGEAVAELEKLVE